MEEQEGNNLKKISFAFLLILLLATGCSTLPIQIPGITQPTLAATLSVPITVTPPPAVNEPAGKPKATATLAPTTPVLPKIDPEKTVSLFLEGKKTGAKFTLTSNLFSAAYASKINDDAGLEAILGPVETLGEYKVGSPSYSADLMKASLEMTIYKPQPTNMRVDLIMENNEWKIDEITPITTGGEYPSNPEGVVLSFLTAYQESPDKMSSFLTGARRGQQPPGGAAGMLQINGSLEGMVVQSAAVSPEPPTASIVVIIRAGGKDYPRKFFLTKEASLWGIDAIEVSND